MRGAGRTARGMQVGAMVLAAVGAGSALGACSSNSSGSNTSSGSATTTSSAPGGSSGGSLSSKLTSLITKVQGQSHATFQATYTSTSTSGTTQTVTIAQQPPKSYFSTSSGAMINDGTKTYYCSTSGGQQTCLAMSSSSNPLAALVDLFSPTTAVTELRSVQSQLAAKIAGVDVSTSSESFAGQQSTCATISAHGQTVKYCVANSAGILTYAEAGGGTFTLTGFTSSPPASDFSLPSGATVQTLPNGVSIP